MFSIRVLTAEDAATYREIRLRALAGDPDAFGSSYEREVAFDGATWRARVSGYGAGPGVVHLAVSDAGASVGVVGVGMPPEDAPEAHLWGMWVAPEGRGTGVGVALLDACAGWARSMGCAELRLDVKRTNAPAIALYARRGFVDVGDTPGEDPCGGGMRMVLPL